MSHTCTVKVAVAGAVLEGVKVMRLFEYVIDPVEMLDGPVRVVQSIGKVPAVKYGVASMVMYLSRAGEIENGDPDGDTTEAAKVTRAVPDDGAYPIPHTVYVKVVTPWKVFPGELQGGVKLMPVVVTAAVPEGGGVAIERLPA